MGEAKQIALLPISARQANTLVRRVHYSRKVVQNSQLHIGIFYRGHLEGAMQFGPPLDRRKVLGLVRDTPWNGMLELNRMAFSDVLPRNSESRALGIAMRLIRHHAPHVQWVLSFADATQCGDGTIYRAAGFVLTQIKRHNELIRLPSGEVRHRIACNTNGGLVASHGGGMMGARRLAASLGGHVMVGYQLRYIYFLDPTARHRLAVPILPFSEIERHGAGMYLGRPRLESEAPGIPVGREGAAMRPDGSISMQETAR